jgi:hypothetical protein
MIGQYNYPESDSDSDTSNSSSDEDIQVYNLEDKAYKSYAKKPYKASKQKTKVKRSPPRNPILRDALLYDTGSTIHIANSKKWFTEYTPNKGNLGTITIREGPIIPSGTRTVVFNVLVKRPSTYRSLVLKNTAYVPSIDVNIFSRIRHYKAGGYLSHETLFDSQKKPLAALDFKNTAFFLTLQGLTPPKAHFLNQINLEASSSSSFIYPLRSGQEIAIDLPYIPMQKRRKYRKIEELDSSDPEEPVSSGPGPRVPRSSEKRPQLAEGSAGNRPCRPAEPSAKDYLEIPKATLLGSLNKEPVDLSAGRPSVPSKSTKSLDLTEDISPIG